MKKQFNLGSSKSKFIRINSVLVLLILIFSFVAAAENINQSNSTIPKNKMLVTLSTKIDEASANEKIPVIIILTDQNFAFNTEDGKSQIESTQKNIIMYLEDAKSKNKAQDIKSIKIVNAIAAKVTPDIIASLAQMPEVSEIELDEIIYIPDKPELSKQMESLPSKQGATSANAWGVDKIGAPVVWQQGINGKGIIVAVIDSGIDVQHPDLDDLDDNPNTNDTKVVGWVDYVNGNTTPYDDNGHGTHVAGTISGTGTSGVNTGVAPGSSLIVAKVFNNDGSGSTSNVTMGFEWAINNHARIINFSGGEKQHDPAWTIAINRVLAARVIPIIASGNSGPGANTIGSPADEINVITVGATNSSDTIASFSSCGPVTLNGQTYIKPDVSAPGVSITSTVPAWYGHSYENLNGTSMATPHVAGTVALMLEKNPTLQLSEVKTILEHTAVDLGPSGKDNEYGSGRINAYDAVFNEQNLNANFSANPTYGYAPLNVDFTDTSSGTPTSWSWDFGDGTNSTPQNPTHTYSTAGNYTVTLTATNADGQSANTSEIKVKLPCKNQLLHSLQV